MISDSGLTGLWVCVGLWLLVIVFGYMLVVVCVDLTMLLSVGGCWLLVIVAAALKIAFSVAFSVVCMLVSLLFC